MPERPVCRPLAIQDFPSAYRLFVDFTKGLQIAPAAVAEAQFARVLAHPGTTIWGAVLGCEVVAMATLHLLPNLTYTGRPYALVENVATLHSQQRRGYGRAVMQAVIGAAWAADAYKIMLLTGQAAGAKGFYEKLGFGAEEKHGMTLRRVPVRQRLTPQI